VVQMIEPRRRSVEVETFTDLVKYPRNKTMSIIECPSYLEH